MPTSKTIEKVILGVDPGTVVMGYSVVHIVKGEIKPLVMDVIKFNTKLDHYTRLAKIFEELSKIVTLYTPDEMALEAPFFGKNVQSMLLPPTLSHHHSHHHHSHHHRRATVTTNSATMLSARMIKSRVYSPPSGVKNSGDRNRDPRQPPGGD